MFVPVSVLCPVFGWDLTTLRLCAKVRFSQRPFYRAARFPSPMWGRTGRRAASSRTSSCAHLCAASNRSGQCPARRCPHSSGHALLRRCPNIGIRARCRWCCRPPPHPNRRRDDYHHTESGQRNRYHARDSHHYRRSVHPHIRRYTTSDRCDFPCTAILCLLLLSVTLCG